MDSEQNKSIFTAQKVVSSAKITDKSNSNELLETHHATDINKNLVCLFYGLYALYYNKIIGTIFIVDAFVSITYNYLCLLQIKNTISNAMVLRCRNVWCWICLVEIIVGLCSLFFVYGGTVLEMLFILQLCWSGLKVFMFFLAQTQ